VVPLNADGLVSIVVAFLAAVTADQRQNAWAKELLGRRDAFARWRGQTGCSIRKVMRALDSLPA
jgi:hypothetical protein